MSEQTLTERYRGFIVFAAQGEDGRWSAKFSASLGGRGETSPTAKTAESAVLCARLVIDAWTEREADETWAAICKNDRRRA